MSDASLTNIRMVRPKGPKIFVGMLAIAAVGAGAWWALRPPGPVGEPEDPAKLLVVGEDADVAATLRELGFGTEHGTFDALAAEGAKQAGGDGKTGIEAILHLADVRGIGYVALEDPSAHGIDGITVTADSADVSAEHGWAVFTVGELGMPPKVTVDAERSALPLPPYVQVLRAAFGHERLANTLFAESQLPIEAVELFQTIKGAVALYSAYGILEGRVAKDLRARNEAVVDAEQAATKPVVLAQALETTDVVALGDGTVLSLRQRWHLDSPREPEVTVQPSAELELMYHPPGTTDPAQRQRCGSLRGGALALGTTELDLSPQGDVVMLESGTGHELWSLDVTAGACVFTRKGIVPQLQPSEFSWGPPHASGRVLRPTNLPQALAVNVWTAGSDKPEVLELSGCTRIEEPVWLDEGHFAISCAYESVRDELGGAYGDPYDDESDDEAAPAAPPPPPAQSWIYLVRLADARAVAIPGTVLGDHTGTYTLHVVPSGEGLDLLAEHPWGGKLLRLRSEQGVAAWLQDAEATFVALAEADAKTAAAASVPGEPSPAEPTQPSEPTEPAEPTPLLRPAFVPVGGMVAALAGERFTVTTLDPGVEIDALVTSPDGTRLAYTTDRGHEVQVLQLETGAVTTVSKNPKVVHRRPRFTADGTAVVFTSDFDGSDRFERVGQRAAL